jgi:hypothetical protein
MDAMSESQTLTQMATASADWLRLQTARRHALAQAARFVGEIDNSSASEK